MWRSSKLAPALVLLVGLVITTAGCGDGCAISCGGWEEADVIRLHGTYFGPADGDGRVLLFDTAERGELEIEVFGNTDALDKGTDYVIPYVGPADLATVQASLPRACGCGPSRGE